MIKTIFLFICFCFVFLFCFFWRYSFVIIPILSAQNIANAQHNMEYIFKMYQKLSTFRDIIIELVQGHPSQWKEVYNSHCFPPCVSMGIVFAEMSTWTALTRHLAREEYSILDQIYQRKYVWISIMKILILYNISKNAY